MGLKDTPETLPDDSRDPWKSRLPRTLYEIAKEQAERGARPKYTAARKTMGDKPQERTDKP